MFDYRIFEIILERNFNLSEEKWQITVNKPLFQNCKRKIAVFYFQDMKKKLKTSFI